MEYKSFGDYLKNLRKEKELTAEEVAEMIEVPSERVKRWERDLEIPELDDIYKLSGFYQVPAEHLLRLKDELFKPNTKIVYAIARILGISVNTLIFLFWAALILGLIRITCGYEVCKGRIARKESKR